MSAVPAAPATRKMISQACLDSSERCSPLAAGLGGVPRAPRSTIFIVAFPGPAADTALAPAAGARKNDGQA